MPCYEDGILDTGESQELMVILRAISGEESEIGELSKTSSLPIDDPVPRITFKGSTFLFTGTYAFGTRIECQTAIEKLGGINAGG